MYLLTNANFLFDSKKKKFPPKRKLPPIRKLHTSVHIEQPGYRGFVNKKCGDPPLTKHTNLTKYLTAHILTGDQCENDCKNVPTKMINIHWIRLAG